MVQTQIKKVILTGFVAIFALITTIGATYAWFTITNTSVIEPMRFGVSSTESLLILLDRGYDIDDPQDAIFLNSPSNYSMTLSNDMIYSPLGSLPGYDYRLIRFKPLTSINGIELFNREGTNVNVSSDPEGEGSYVEFSIWLLSQSMNATIGLSNYLAVASNSISSKDAVLNAFRLSIQSPSSSQAPIFGYDKDYDFIFTTGMVGFSNNPLIPNFLSESNKSIRMLNHGLYHAGSVDFIEDVNVSNLESATPLFTLTKEVPLKVTIRLWVEGWDKDANNNLISSGLSVSFEFTVIEFIP